MLSWLRLIRSRRVGPGTFQRLLTEYGSAAAALTALPEVARAAGLRDYAPFSRTDAEAEMAAGQAAGAVLLCLGDPCYPPALADIADAPPVLWCRGDITVLERPAVALVGARNASSLGLRMARALAGGLGEAGFTVVSGLARGIDTAAHEAALATGTVAVMAGGVDVIYPAENAPLADRIAQRGLMISEQPMGLQPQARHFPRRNRIVSGLALGVVVVEGATRSGSLITAGNALDQGREVMAVPGHPFDARASGCNALIRDGATLVRGTADITTALAGRFGAQTLPGTPTSAGTPPAHARSRHPPPTRTDPPEAFDGPAPEPARTARFATDQSSARCGACAPDQPRTAPVDDPPPSLSGLPPSPLGPRTGDARRSPRLAADEADRPPRGQTTTSAGLQPPSAGATAAALAPTAALAGTSRPAAGARATSTGAAAPRAVATAPPADPPAAPAGATDGRAAALASPTAAAAGDRRAMAGKTAPRREPVGPGGLTLAILDRLGPSPIAEDQLIRDLALSAACVAPELLLLELDGRVVRQPGGLLARLD